jgi:hypothetical protein
MKARQHVCCGPNGNACSTHRFVPDDNRFQQISPSAAPLFCQGKRCRYHYRSRMTNGFFMDIVELKRVS